MKNVIFKITCSGAIIHNGKILILQRSSDDDIFPNLWELPSGKKEPMEKVEDAVAREVLEETGLSVSVDSILDTFNFLVEKPEEIRDFTQLVFAVRPDKNVDVKISSEHQDFRWIDKNELENFNISKETKAAIRKAFSKIL